MNKTEVSGKDTAVKGRCFFRLRLSKKPLFPSRPSAAGAAEEAEAGDALEDMRLVLLSAALETLVWKNRWQPPQSRSAGRPPADDLTIRAAYMTGKQMWTYSLHRRRGPACPLMCMEIFFFFFFPFGGPKIPLANLVFCPDRLPKVLNRAEITAFESTPEHSIM